MHDPKVISALLNKAKIALMQHPKSAFYTTIVLSMKFLWDDTQPTAYTNGQVIGFNRDFFMKCSLDERVGVLVHEASHVAHLHIERKQHRDHRLFNCAADHAINLDLLANGFKLPGFCLADRRFTGMSTEMIYRILEQEQQDDPGQPMPDPGMDDLREPTDEDGKPMAPQEVKKMVDDIIIRAAIQAKMQDGHAGNIPGDIELYLAKLLNPKLPWQHILRKWLKAQAKSDYSWKRPNRRFMPDHYLPSMHSEGAMIDFQAFVDISGSETDEDFLRFISELHGILKMMKPKKIWLGQFDTRIKSITLVKNVMDLANVKFHGRGGTIITEVLDHAEKTKPKVCMIFSDGGFHIDRQKCSANILWMIHDNPGWAAPFGRVIHYNTHD